MGRSRYNLLMTAKNLIQIGQTWYGLPVRVLRRNGTLRFIYSRVFADSSTAVGSIGRAISCCNSVDPLQRNLRMVAAVARPGGSRIGQIGPALGVERAGDGIAESGQRLRGGVGVHLATVLAKADVTRVMGDVLNRPVPTPQLGHLGQSDQRAWQAGNQILDVDADSLGAVLTDPAGTPHHLRDVGKGEKVVESRRAFQQIVFAAPMTAGILGARLILPEVAFTRALGWQDRKGVVYVVVERQ